MSDPRSPSRPILSGCTVLNKDADEIATISTNTVSNPLEEAAVAVANHEAANGYPGFKGGAEGSDPHRIEWLLGTVLADAVSLIASAGIEYSNADLTADTKAKYADLIARLRDIWYASRFGSFDGETRVIDPYFANFGGDPRMSFAAAAQHYGMVELRRRFPDESETTLNEALSWPLDLLRDTLMRLSPQ